MDPRTAGIADRPILTSAMVSALGHLLVFSVLSSSVEDYPAVSAGIEPIHVSASVPVARAPVATLSQASQTTASHAQGGVSRPLEFRPTPAFPEIARERGWQGSVTLAVDTDPTGLVVRTEITQSSGFEVLDQAAAETVSTWRLSVYSAQAYPLRVEFRLDE